MIPNKNIVTGPVYMVLADVPSPLALPFGYFPFTKDYSSGIIFPTFGEDYNRGFYLRDGGYYFAISDYVDLALRGEIYTKGSWGISGHTSYVKRYKFRGNFDFIYHHDIWRQRQPRLFKAKQLPGYLEPLTRLEGKPEYELLGICEFHYFRLHQK